MERDAVNSQTFCLHEAMNVAVCLPFSRNICHDLASEPHQ